eukprot:CAMPEP_0182471218 /NCGR_PEP_ID=MMETSP1319-20130603/19920_1 /TAXON_ID=172717 /ORGANISM="Bolidomonas pacifica, Strain RCC208" /LENGTH=600 /DNA_ID=CAMNT_0024671745 /DNA_START=25 /DNA_END=1824 /DNA_ORIENTATION=-
MKRNPTDPESMRTRDFVEVISKDLQMLKGKIPMRADLEVMHKSESSNHPDKKFKFSCFVNSVFKIATKKKSSTKTPDEQAVDFIVKYVKPLAAKRKVKDISEQLKEVEGLFRTFAPALKNVFMFFATLPSSYEKEQLKRHEPREDVNAMTQSLHFDSYIASCSMFNLSASIGAGVKALSPSALASAFIDSIQVKECDSVGGLTFEEFWETLVRCSLIFQRESAEHDTTLSKVAHTFVHMANNLETAVPRLLKLGNITESTGVMAGMTSGGRDASSAGALLQHGTHEFGRLVLELLREEEGEKARSTSVHETTFDSAAIEEKVWRIFIKSNVTNNPRDWSAMRKRELVLIVRSQKTLRLMEADVNVIHQAEAGRNPNRRLEFKNFQEALRSIAKRAFPKDAKEGVEKALEKLLKDYLLKDDELLHNAMEITQAEKIEALDFTDHFNTAFKRIFSFFATQRTEMEKNELGRHLAQEDGINVQTCSMKWADFLNFSSTANLSSGTGTALTALSLTQLSSAFVDSINVSYVNDVGGLTFEEFKMVLVRCAKLFPYEASDTIRIRLEKMFLHMCNQFQTSVPRILNDGNERVGKGGQTAGGRATS